MSRHSPNLRMWDDLRFPAQGINPPGAASDPTVETATGLLLFEAINPDLIAGVAQLPHAWAEESTIVPHVHWSKTSSAAGGVYWQLDYELVNNGSVASFAYGTSIGSATPVAGTPDNDTDSEMLITSLGEIDMTGQRISSLIFFQLSRQPAHASDTYGANARLAEFDIHFQIDAFGSEHEFIKQNY